MYLPRHFEIQPQPRSSPRELPLERFGHASRGLVGGVLLVFLEVNCGCVEIEYAYLHASPNRFQARW